MNLFSFIIFLFILIVSRIFLENISSGQTKVPRNILENISSGQNKICWKSPFTALCDLRHGCVHLAPEKVSVRVGEHMDVYVKHVGHVLDFNIRFWEAVETFTSTKKFQIFLFRVYGNGFRSKLCHHSYGEWIHHKDRPNHESPNSYQKLMTGLAENIKLVFIKIQFVSYSCISTTSCSFNCFYATIFFETTSVFIYEYWNLSASVAVPRRRASWRSSL